jgi:hypothetical protein
MTALVERAATDTARAVRSGDVAPVEPVDAHIERIHAPRRRPETRSWCGGAMRCARTPGPRSGSVIAGGSPWRGGGRRRFGGRLKPLGRP